MPREDALCEDRDLTKPRFSGPTPLDGTVEVPGLSG